MGRRAARLVVAGRERLLLFACISLRAAAAAAAWLKCENDTAAQRAEIAAPAPPICT